MRPVHHFHLWPIWTTFFTLDLVLALSENDKVVELPWSDSYSLGFDGPWHALEAKVEYNPGGSLFMLPSLLDTNIIIDMKSCNAAECDPLPYSRELLMTAMEKDPSIDGSNYEISDLMENLHGQEQFTGGAVDTWQGFEFKITLWNWTDEMPYYLHKYMYPNIPALLTVSRGIRTPPPFGNNETLAASFLSLNASRNATELIFTAQDGTTHPYNTTLRSFFDQGLISSQSFALQVGSVTQNVTPSLHLGGYDGRRFLDHPALFDMSNPDGTGIDGIGLSVYGDSAFSNKGDFDGSDLKTLKAYLSGTTRRYVRFDPGVPYLYLPKETCDSFARYIPITYSSDLDLYLWDTGADNYTSLVNTTHYVDFGLTSASGFPGATVKVPLALLHLNLTEPIAKEPMAYFPCRPYTDANSTEPVILGRAFLQAAYMSVNWENNMMAIGQAPGPNMTYGGNASISVITSKTFSDNSVYADPGNKDRQFQWTWGTVLRPLGEQVDNKSAAVRASSMGWLWLVMSVWAIWALL